MAVPNITADLYDSLSLLRRAVATLEFLPSAHLAALDSCVQVMAPSQLNPNVVFHSSLLASQSTIQALLASFSRAPAIISQMTLTKKSIERNYNSVNRSTRWPLGLLDDTRQRMNEEKEEKARQAQEEFDDLGRELRSTQQVIAGELAGFHGLHEQMGRKSIREYARGMLVQERLRLEGMLRSLRRLKETTAEQPIAIGVPAMARGGNAHAGEVPDEQDTSDKNASATSSATEQ